MNQINRCCAIGNFRGDLDLKTRTIDGYPVIVSKTLRNYLRTLPETNFIDDWLVYPRFRRNKWQFYALKNKPTGLDKNEFVVKGVIKWVRVRQDRKLDIGVRIVQKHHNNFVIVLIASNDKYYKRRSMFQFKCYFEPQIGELVSQESVRLQQV